MKAPKYPGEPMTTLTVRLPVYSRIVTGKNYLTGDNIMLNLIEEIGAKLAERAEFIAYINTLITKGE